MHSSIDRNALLKLMQTVSPKAMAFYVTGSAAHDGKNWITNGDGQSGSDIDIICIDLEETRFRYRQLAGRKVEIHQYSTRKIDDICAHPEWFGPAWVFELGKIAGADILYHDPSAPDWSDPAKYIYSKIPVRSRQFLLGVLTLVGQLATADEKEKEGRQVSVDRRQLQYALHCLVTHKFPHRFSVPDGNYDIGIIDKFETDLSDGIRKCIALDTNGILYYPEHWAAVTFLDRRWGLKVALPDDGVKL